MLLFLSPWILGFIGFYVYPMIASLYYSFTHYNFLTPPQWVGLSNYKFMFTSDPYFWIAVRNTIWLTFWGTVTSVLFALGVAIVLTWPKRGRGIYRTIFFIPTMVPIVAASLGFVFLLSYNGPFDSLLHFLHLGRPLWFDSPNLAKPGLLVLGMWGIGDTMIIFLAALLDVPKQLYEAADLEGASSWQRFRHVTVPWISPVLFFTVVINVIYGFQYFTEAFVAGAAAAGANATNPSGLGYPLNSTLVYTEWLYQEGFQSGFAGYASALAWVLFLVILACTLVLIKTSNRWVHYQGGGFR